MDEGQTIYAAEAVVVRGVFNPVGSTSWKRREGGFDRIDSLSLVAWRIDDGEVKRQRLGMRSVVQVPEGKSPFATKSTVPSLYRSFGVVEIELRLSSCQKRALCVGELVPAVDAELQQIVDELSETLVVPTDFAGNLTRLRGSVEWFAGQAQWLGSAVRVDVEADGDLPADSTITTAAALWANQEKVTREVTALLTAEHRKADSENARTISLEGLKLSNISIRREGWYQFVFDDETNFGYNARVAGRHGEGPSRVTFKN